MWILNAIPPYFLKASTVGYGEGWEARYHGFALPSRAVRSKRKLCAFSIMASVGKCQIISKYNPHPLFESLHPPCVCFCSLGMGVLSNRTRLTTHTHTQRLTFMMTTIGQSMSLAAIIVNDSWPSVVVRVLCMPPLYTHRGSCPDKRCPPSSP